MAKKRWALAKRNGDFIYRGNVKRLFSIWETLELKRIANNPAHTDSIESNTEVRFGDLEFYSTQKDESMRYRLFPVSLGYFRYEKGGASTQNSGGDGETASHQLAILALAQLKTVNFIINNKPITIKFKYFDVDGEETRIQLGGNKRYYPDLIGYLEESSINFKKWGGKLAIEVKVTHGYKSYDPRIILFRRHNFAVLQVTITENFKYGPERKISYGNDTPEALKEHYDFLVKRFSKEVFATILSDPMTTEFSETSISKYKEKIRDLEHQVQSVSKSLEQKNILVREHAQKINSYKSNHNLAIKELIQNHEHQVKSLKDQMKSLRNMAAEKATIFCISTIVLIFSVFPSYSTELLNKFFNQVFNLHYYITSVPFG